MGVKLGIITNGSISEQSKKIEKLNIRSYFDSVIISDAVSIKKPDRRIFQLSLDELGVNAEEAIYVGDHPSNDVVGALDAGLDAIWLKGQEEWNIEYVIPEKIAIRLEDLIDLVSC
jgi:putative hydrolase of the HAD superfamily